MDPVYFFPFMYIYHYGFESYSQAINLPYFILYLLNWLLACPGSLAIIDNTSEILPIVLLSSMACPWVTRVAGLHSQVLFLPPFSPIYRVNPLASRPIWIPDFVFYDSRKGKRATRTNWERKWKVQSLFSYCKEREREAISIAKEDKSSPDYYHLLSRGKRAGRPSQPIRGQLFRTAWVAKGKSQSTRKKRKVKWVSNWTKWWRSEQTNPPIEKETMCLYKASVIPLPITASTHLDQCNYLDCYLLHSIYS